jgi:hypothetical protein
MCGLLFRFQLSPKVAKNRVPLDWVAGFTWTEWQPSDGLGGRNPLNTQLCMPQAISIT